MPPGGDKNNFAGQVVAAAQRIEHRVGDGRGLSHAPRAHHAAGQFAGAGLDDANAALAQRFEIGLGGGMVPHVHVHRGSDQHRRIGGQVHGGQKIVGDAVRKFGQDVGGGRRDHQRLGPLRLADVLDGGIVGAFGGAGLIPQAGDDLVAGERGKGERLHKLRGRLGHHHVHFERLALQFAHQFRRLVRGDPARYAYGYSHSLIVEQWSVEQFTVVRFRDQNSDAGSCDEVKCPIPNRCMGVVEVRRAAQ